MSGIYIVLAVLGLSFLVFIHELGHYIVARRVGMRVEVFSIGFGRSILSWRHRGVLWQIGILPFGGYVKIAGMEKEGDTEPHDIPDGFFGKKPLDRIKVALAGPIVNIAFTLGVFSCLWFAGGREQSFSENTHIIGYVDPQSALYEKGVRPGDVLTRYGDRPFDRFQDILHTSISNDSKVHVEGYSINYFDDERARFTYTLPTYEHPELSGKGIQTIGILAPADYLLVGGELPEWSPMRSTGLRENDRVVWADGELIFSLTQLSHILSEQAALLTVNRDGQTLQLRVPRVRINALQLTQDEQLDFEDRKHEAGFGAKSTDSLMTIPYALSFDATVEKSLPKFPLSDDEVEKTDATLRPGDTILAVDGAPIQQASDLFGALQHKKVLTIVQSNDPAPLVPLSQADHTFTDTVEWHHVRDIVSSIGVNPTKELGNVRMLKPVEPITWKEIERRHGDSQAVERLALLRKQIDEQSNASQKQAMEEALDKQLNAPILGIAFTPQNVLVNPNPIQMMGQVFDEMWWTLSSVFSGRISPKWMSGPVGIMQIMHMSWTKGVRDAIYWLGLISLNLGVLNLLPIPVLDGGHILMSVYEMTTKKRITAKTMQRLVLPFVVLLIMFFVYVTYQDLSRFLGL